MMYDSKHKLIVNFSREDMEVIQGLMEIYDEQELDSKTFYDLLDTANCEYRGQDEFIVEFEL